MEESGYSFAVDENGNVLYQYYKNDRYSSVLKLRLTVGTTITPSLDGNNSISSGTVISGKEGKIYLVKKAESKTLQLYQFATQVETLKSVSGPNKKYVMNGQKDGKFVRITLKDSFEILDSGIELKDYGRNGASTDTAVFITWGVGKDYRLFRFAGGKLDEVALPSGAKLGMYNLSEGNIFTVAGSDYIYTRFGNKFYRAGATGKFKINPPFFDGRGLTFNGRGLKRTYTITSRTNHRGEFAIAAEDIALSF